MHCTTKNGIFGLCVENVMRVFARQPRETLAYLGGLSVR